MIAFTMYRLMCKSLLHAATRILGTSADAALFMTDVMEEMEGYFE